MLYATLFSNSIHGTHLGITLCRTHCTGLPCTPIHHCPSSQLSLSVCYCAFSIFHTPPPSQSLCVSCLFILLLISHLAQCRFLAHTCLPARSLSFLFFFKLPEHKGLSCFSVNITCSLPLSAIPPCPLHYLYPQPRHFYLSQRASY